MTAANKDRAANQHGEYPVEACISLPAAAAARIFQGTFVAVPLSGTDNGYARPASASAIAQRIVGVAKLPCDNTSGAAGAEEVVAETGVFEFENSGTTDAITNAHINQPCYAADDQTVALTPGAAGTRPYAGRIMGLSGSKVRVQVGGPQADPQGNIDVPFLAGADMSTTGINRFVKLSAANTVIVNDTAGGPCVGVCMNSPTNGAVAIVRTDGFAFPIASGTISAGTIIASDNEGRTKEAVSGRTNTNDAGATNDPLIGSFALGQAHAAGAVGVQHRVRLQQMGAIPQTAQ